MRFTYQHTLYACFTGYIVQAIVNNFVPLLFLTFCHTYNIALSRITLLITFNFGLQLLIDLLSAWFIDRIGYRLAAILAHVFAAAGLIALAVLPDLMPSPFCGLLLAVSIYAIGGGLLEVLVSPIVESCPTRNKEKAMSLLHSFYCWGHVAVVLISSGFFVWFGLENWRILALLWALVPILNLLLFAKVPLGNLLPDGATGWSIGKLLKNRVFWLMVLLMVCSGGSEQAVSQWASTFAEQGLHLTKAVGDLAGPLAFAICMGTSRAFYGKYGDRINLQKFMLISTVCCLAAYLLIALVPNALVGLAGCALCGFTVGIMWPGTFSQAAAALPLGGTAMFAFFALAGDLGCAAGPTVVGLVSGQFNDNLRWGILAAAVFPTLLLLGLCGIPATRRAANINATVGIEQMPPESGK